MKRIILICLVALAGVTANAQKVAVSGIVNDSQGKPLAFAFIKDAVRNYATFTDVYGAFTFRVDTADRLIVTAPGFKGTVVKVNDPKNVTVTLTADGSAMPKQIDQDALRERLSGEGMTKSVASGYIAKEASLHGTRYLFETWAHGFVIDADDSLKQNNTYLFNYNKIDGSLILTKDGKSVNEIDRGEVRSFTLFDEAGQAHVFEKLPAADPTHFLQVLASGGKYKIYKKFGTKFYPNDYVSNGMTSTGHNYDEIKDNPEYFAVKVPGGAPQKFALKGKAIKTTFDLEPAKAGKYLSDHDTDIDDDYLKELGNYLNN
jgi:hypothetical protein